MYIQVIKNGTLIVSPNVSPVNTESTSNGNQVNREKKITRRLTKPSVSVLNCADEKLKERTAQYVGKVIGLFTVG